MNWLISAINEQVDFGPEIKLLVALKKLHRKGISLREIFRDVLITGQEISLAAYPELTGDEKLELQAVLGALPTLLKEAFGYDVSDYPEELKFLGQTFSSLGDESIGHTWQLINRRDSADGIPIEGLVFKMSGGASTGIHIQTNPSLPEGIPGSILEPASFSLTFQGGVYSDTVLEGNTGTFKLKLGARVAGVAELQYFFGHTRDTVVADALLKSVRHLISPFNVADIYAGIEDGKHLNAIQLTVDGNIKFDGKLGFANSVKLDKKGMVTAGLDAWVGFELSESGRFNYLITKADGTPHLYVRVRRARISSTQISEGISIGIDMTKWAENVYPEISDQLSSISSLLEEAKEFLPGKGALRHELTEALNSAIGDSNFKDEIKYALGFSSGDRIDTIITRKLLPPIESTASVWLKDTSNAAKNLVAELFDRIDLGTRVENQLQDKLQDELKKALNRLHSQLRDKVSSIIDNLPAEVLQQRLEKLGRNIQDGINRADDKVAALTEAVREQLSLVQQRLARLKKPFEDASKAKILYKYGALRRDEDGRSLDIQFSLDSRHPDAQRVLDDILSGNLGPHMVQAKSPAIVGLSGTYKRYQAIVQSDQFNTVLFGLGFDGSTEAKIRSIISVDPQGNIQALSNQEWERRYGRSVDERRLTFANAREINASANLKDITVNFGLSMEDKALEANELNAFLLPFEKVGLLPLGIAANAQSYIGSSLPGHIELGMALTISQLDCMVEKSEQSDGVEVLRIGAEVFEQLAMAQPPNQSFTEMLPDFLVNLSEDTGQDLRSISKSIQGWSRSIELRAENVAEISGDRLTSEKLDRLTTWLDARHTALAGKEKYCGSWAGEEGTLHNMECSAWEEARPGMVQFLKAIANIRQRKLDINDLDNEAQLLKSLNDTQMQMNLALRNWHSHGKDFAKWWIYNDREPRLFSMALFLLLARLSQSSPASALPTLSAAITLTNTNGDRNRFPLT